MNHPNNFCECIVTFYSFSASKEKIDQVISVVLSMLAKNDIGRFWSGSLNARLFGTRNPGYLKKKC